MKVASVFVVVELVLIAIVVDMIGRIHAGGIAATTGTPGGSALRFALECGVAGLIVPPMGWIVVRAMR